MQGYSQADGACCPASGCIPITQAGMARPAAGVLVPVPDRRDWVSVAFYFSGLILGVLLISQFWTLANEVYDPRQAKRLFGFIGGGAEPRRHRGIVHPHVAASSDRPDEPAAGRARPSCWSARVIVVADPAARAATRSSPRRRRPARRRRQRRPRRSSCCAHSKHLQIIALVIGFAAIGAAIIEQQLNMAARGRQGPGHRLIRRSSAQVQCAVDHRLRHPDLAHEQDPPVPRHRVRAADPAGQPGHDRR